MNKLQSIVNIVCEQQKLLLAPSTYDVRKNYLSHLVSRAEELGISEPCQELYNSYVARATTPDLRFQLCHAIRLVDKEAGTKAFTPEGKLYNEPEIPSPGKMGVKHFFYVVDRHTCILRRTPAAGAVASGRSAEPQRPLATADCSPKIWTKPEFVVC